MHVTERPDTIHETNETGTGRDIISSLEKNKTKKNAFVCFIETNSFSPVQCRDILSSSPLSPSQVIVLVYVLLSPRRTLPIS